MIEIISATRKSAADAQSTALGKSITRLIGIVDMEISFYTDNSTGLPEIYNREIRTGPDDNILLFVHDDVWIEDIFFDHNLTEGLKTFDILGVVGNRRRLPGATTWELVSTPPELVFDSPNLSGRLAHGPGPLGVMVKLGPSKLPCQLIDGVFMAARRGTLRRAGVYFDERFTFHMYDMDFCRTATKAGLRIGTWPISITHESVGSLDAAWRAASEIYLAKWGD